MRGRDIWILWGIGALLLFGGGYVTYKATRGLRNNNPGNIRRSSEAWQGLSPEQSDDEFFSFVSPEYGIRAMARILTNYSANYGLDTVRGIISRWAPPTENLTDAYIASVARSLGVAPNAPINVQISLPRLIPAIIKHENGIQPYSASTITRGISLAFA